MKKQILEEANRIYGYLNSELKRLDDNEALILLERLVFLVKQILNNGGKDE